MSAASDTLFLPLKSGEFNFPGNGEILFLNARFHPFMHEMAERFSLYLQQYFKPYALQLQHSGFVVSNCRPAMGYDPGFDGIFLNLPKNIEEAKSLIACAILHLKEGGWLCCAAGNKEGGSRLKKLMAQSGLSDICQISKNKARVCWAQKKKIDCEGLEEQAAKLSLQKILEGRYLSTPGLFGWDRIDRGSEMLAAGLPENLAGSGADYGCGYGYLSDQILQRNKGVQSLTCIDADFRALEAARENLKAYDHVDQRFFWEDLTQWSISGQGFDWIVMNPPFHAGKQADFEIGRDFIRMAAKSLVDGGVLYMVANRQAPYEEVLKELFSKILFEREKDGFKIYHMKK